jgi:hypothetical protein
MDPTDPAPLHWLLAVVNIALEFVYMLVYDDEHQKTSSPYY